MAGKIDGVTQEYLPYTNTHTIILHIGDNQHINMSKINKHNVLRPVDNRTYTNYLKTFGLGIENADIGRQRGEGVEKNSDIGRQRGEGV